MASIVAPSTDAAPAARILEELVRRRRAMPRFTDEAVPAGTITRALRIAAEAPSGYNFQPWRFLVLRSEDRRNRLRAAAYDQEKITEAPLVVVATADREAWRENVDEILLARAHRTGKEPTPEKLAEQRGSALGFVDQLPPEVWLTRQVMISFTYLMLAFESLGWQTAPMEGFDADSVRKELHLPASTEIIALLAVGRGAEPAPPHPGRLPVERIAYDEFHGSVWEHADSPAPAPEHPSLEG
jgi:nitroreductase